MDCLSLPDEMCASILKYCPSTTVLKCRRISNRIDKIGRKYDLNRMEVQSLTFNTCDWELSESELAKNRTELEELLKSKNKYRCPVLSCDLERWLFITPPYENEHKVCRVKVQREERCRYIIQQYTEQQNVYDALDICLHKVRGVNSIYIYGEYNIEMDSLICRNKKAFKNATEIVFTCGINCNTMEFMFSKVLKNIREIYCTDMFFGFFNSTANQATSEYDVPLPAAVGGVKNSRKRKHIEEVFLSKFVNNIETPFIDNISFTSKLPTTLFTKFILKLVQARFTGKNDEIGELIIHCQKTRDLHDHLREHGITRFRTDCGKCLKFKNRLFYKDLRKNTINFFVE